MAAIRLENRVLDQVIPTRLDVFTHNLLVVTAKHQKITRTALVRLAIREYLKITKPSAA
ncbi:hypothetical protein [Nostoc sp.]|uniref:hypothetical protein n=1 Tax=Nostoc sp. TaxID=1180 RepID=UPI003593B71F